MSYVSIYWFKVNIGYIVATCICKENPIWSKTISAIADLSDKKINSTPVATPGPGQIWMTPAPVKIQLRLIYIYATAMSEYPKYIFLPVMEWFHYHQSWLWGKKSLLVHRYHRCRPPRAAVPGLSTTRRQCAGTQVCCRRAWTGTCSNARLWSPLERKENGRNVTIIILHKKVNIINKRRKI